MPGLDLEPFASQVSTLPIEHQSQPHHTYLQGLLIIMHEEGHHSSTAATDAMGGKDQDDRAEPEVKFCKGRKQEGCAWHSSLGTSVAIKRPALLA